MSTYTNSNEKLAKALKDAYEKGKHDALHPTKKPKVTSGWQSPDSKEFYKFLGMLEKLVEVKFGKDVDGSCPVRVYLLDRTRYEDVSWWPVPYTIHDDKMHPYSNTRWHEEDHTPQKNVARQRALLDNIRERMRAIDLKISNATETLKRYFSEAEYDLRDKDEAPPKVVKKKIEELERLVQKWTDPVAWYENQGYDNVNLETGTYEYIEKRNKSNKGEVTIYHIDEKPDMDAINKELEKLKKWKYPDALPWESVAKIQY